MVMKKKKKKNKRRRCRREGEEEEEERGDDDEEGEEGAEGKDGEEEEEEEEDVLWPGNAIQADAECEVANGRQYLGRLAEAHDIDPPGHQALHKVVHSCIGVSTCEYGCERVYRPAVDHDFNEGQQGASLPCAGWTLHTHTITVFNQPHIPWGLTLS